MTIAIVLAVALAVLLVLRYTDQSKVSTNRLAKTGPSGGDGDGESPATQGGSGKP